MKRQISASWVTGLFLTYIAVWGAIFVAGCNDLKKIPAFNPEASLLNKIASVEEIEIEVNGMLAELVRDGILTQAEVKKTFTPSIDKAEAIWRASRAVARGASPTTQPAGTLEDAKTLLLSVRSVLVQIRSAHGSG